MTATSTPAMLREAAMMDASNNHVWARKTRAICKERDALKAEVERLRKALLAASPSTIGAFSLTPSPVAASEAPKTAINAAVDAGGAEADDDPACTDCGGTGITYQTERRCACQPSAPDAQSDDDPDCQCGSEVTDMDGHTVHDDDCPESWQSQATIRKSQTVAQTAGAVVKQSLTADPAPVDALVRAAEKVVTSYWADTDGTISGIYDLERAIAAIREAKP